MLGAVILCASELRFAWGGGGGDLIRLAGDTGYDGIAVGSRCGRGDVAPLIAAAASAGLAVPVVAALLPDAWPGLDRRVPYLGSTDDANERRAALDLFDATLAAVGPLGVRLFTVDFGEVPLRTSAAVVAWRFARRELGEDEPGDRDWVAATSERRARSGLILDTCRSILDRLLPAAERRDVVLALEIAGGPWGAPSPREALILLDEYRDGPVGGVWDTARMQVLETLGLAPVAERRTALAAASRLWRENEAVGVEAGYLPGLGDPDGGSSDVETGRRRAPAGVPIVITGSAASTPAEVERARTLVTVASG